MAVPSKSAAGKLVSCPRNTVRNRNRLLDDLRNDPAVTIVHATDALLEKGIRLYRSRPDKDWPLTDCISFSVMAERGVSDALTGDRHFEQAGFRALLK